ncbi:MAG TPA: GNAT family N-acetyltransferase [Alcanivorax sp.]|nr:GNAT family N-acetyltransferase [Alcanivorax sp.]
MRPYRDGDAAALARVFREAVLVTAADHYDADQRQAWSAAADDPTFPADLAKGLTMVAEWQQETAGFAQLVDDRITLIYVHPDTARLGIATLLYQHLEDEARIQGRERLVTEASQVAHDFFLFLGFQPDAEETVERDGVTLYRWRMHKPLI